MGKKKTNEPRELIPFRSMADLPDKAKDMALLEVKKRNLLKTNLGIAFKDDKSISELFKKIADSIEDDPSTPSPSQELIDIYRSPYCPDIVVEAVNRMRLTNKTWQKAFSRGR